MARSEVRTPYRFVVVAIAATIVATACASSAVPVSSVSASIAPVRGGRIVVAIPTDDPPGEPVDLDPLSASDGGQYDTLGLITGQLYDTLAVSDRVTGEIVPNLAKWTVGADGRTYEFEIAPNADWSDGRPIVAEDFLTAMRAFARTRTGFGRAGVGMIEGFTEYREGKATTITGIRTDGKHLTIRFKTILCPALNVPLLTPPLPTHVFARYLSDQDPTKNTDAATEHRAPSVTSGPFLLKEWRRGDELVLQANPRYWRGAPLVDELAFRFIQRQALAAAFQQGTVSVAFWYAREVDTLHEAERNGLRVHRFPQPSYEFIGWNTRSRNVPGLQDRRIRQALAYGLDVDLIVRQVLQGEGGRIRQHMPLTSWAFTPGLNDYPYDPAKAEALIRSAGYTKGADGVYARDGRALAPTILVPEGNPIRRSIAQLAADQYRAIGVRLVAQLDSFAHVGERVFRKVDPSIDAFALGWVFVTDPNPVPYWYSKTPPGPEIPVNGAGYVNAELDRALDDGRFGPDCSLPARKRAYDTFNRILNEDQPYNFLFWQNHFVVTSPRVRGIVPGTFMPLPDSHLWWLAPK